MKFKFLALMIVLVFASCKDNKTNKAVESTDYSETELDVTTSTYPEAITKVFTAHGGVDTWKEMQTLKFTIDKKSGKETITTDLYNRKAFVQMPKHTIGFDGQDVWLKKQDTTSFKGNPKFYYNLMFYFYAMPFVLADDGIVYKEAKPLDFEGKTYPGIKISYQSGVGESPEDEYIVYYDSETNKMAWLGYTVTFFSKEKGKEFHFIKYSEWQNVNGVQLPKTLTWYNYKNNMPTTKRNDVEFSDVRLTEMKMKAKVFAKPEGAEVIK
jgi:hypothetical protein